MSLPIFCAQIHSVRVISIIVYGQTHGWKNSLSHDAHTHTLETLLLFSGRWSMLLLVVFFILYAVVAIHFLSPFGRTSEIVCFVEHHQLHNILTNVNVQICLLISVILSPFEFGFILDLGQIFYLIYFIYLDDVRFESEWEMKREYTPNCTSKSLRFKFNESHTPKPKRNAGRGGVVVDISTKHT